MRNQSNPQTNAARRGGHASVQPGQTLIRNTAWWGQDRHSGVMKVLALAAAAALAARAGAEHTVWRPADWGGPFRKDKDITESTKVADSVFGHGIAQPHVLPCGHLGEHKLEGFECYRVYLVLDTNIAETIYAGRSAKLRTSLLDRCGP